MVDFPVATRESEHHPASLSIVTIVMIITITATTIFYYYGLFIHARWFPKSIIYMISLNPYYKFMRQVLLHRQVTAISEMREWRHREIEINFARPPAKK